MAETHPVSPSVMLEEQLPLIHSVIGAACVRRRLADADRKDFTSYVTLKLLENDGARLRRFRGESSFKTYLTVVVQRLLLDFCRQERGSWRASARALAAGRHAVRLEQLLARDGFSFDEACHRLQSEGVELSRDDLWRIAETFPRRIRPRFSDIDSLSELPAARGETEAVLFREDRDALQERLAVSFKEAMKTLPPRDALVVKMWYEKGMRAPVIAGALRIRTREVYGIIARSTGRLRRVLKDRFEPSEVMEMVDRREISVDLFQSRPGPIDLSEYESRAGRRCGMGSAAGGTSNGKSPRSLEDRRRLI